MSRRETLFGIVTGYSRLVIVVLLVLTVAVGAGGAGLEQSSSLDQFQSDTLESEKLDYIESNFSTGQDNTTAAQLIIRDGNVLSKASLLDVLDFERRLAENETVSATLAGNESIVGIPNVLAIAAIQRDIGAELQATTAQFQQLNASLQERRAMLASERAALEQRRRALNRSLADLRTALDRLRANPEAPIRPAFEGVQANASIDLSDARYPVFRQAVADLRNATRQAAVEAASRAGTRGVLAEHFSALQDRGERLAEQAAALEADGERLRELGRELATLQGQFENASGASLAEQRARLAAMNASEIDATIRTVLGQNAGAGSAISFMPTGYEPGSTTANATMLLVTQRAAGGMAAGGASDQLVTSQLAMQSLAADAVESAEVLVFGLGVITDEITRSMTDSLAIVGPLALLFVVVALTIAYRDPLDILLGVFGIAAVLVWTFGFMGWAGIAFNQIFVAVPVLLIGLSIDYAIHIFMRHREERNNEHTASDPRGAMRVAVAGVGIALTWVTATTAIGFLSNVTSPVPPIREFGVVSAAGIVATMLVFGLLIPALKVEIDEFFEARGWSRKKTAFGTGGGRFSALLATGATAAKKAPYLVIALALLVSAGGAYGATQVDTSFNQEDFLAEEPPGWTQQLPEPFKPGEYSAKANLEYVTANFIREDSQAQVLVEGTVTDPATLDRVADAQAAAVSGPDSVVQVLPNGDPDVQSPLSVMRTVAASNASFNATLTAADTDDDGVPDRNLAGVYDALFAVAPTQAAGVIHRTATADYEALRLVFSVSGSGDAVTAGMRDVAATLSGGGLTATATGQTILFKIVQDNLLDTVIESLLITLVAIFAFLMVTYRLTEGSATLGAFTLLPVVLSVSWILGTMAIFDIPFNILTGMITSLTVGLGVAYSIHLSERYNQELDRADSMWRALRTAVTGTGGALLGSAATTVGGFGVLAVAILPPLQQFGVITGLTIIYAFLASVLVLPSLLVVWTRWFGPGGARTERAGDAERTVPTDD